MFQYVYIFAPRCRITFDSSTYEIYKIKQIESLNVSKFNTITRLQRFRDENIWS